MKRVLLIPQLLGIFILTSCLGSQKPAPVTYYGQSEGAGSAGVHTVEAGDTLYSISKRYKIAMRDIALSNRLGASFALSPGQRLKLPPPQEYRARAGDTLYAVSRLFGVGPSEIASLNSLKAPYVIRQGQVLRMPSASSKMADLNPPSPPQGEGRREGGAKQPSTKSLHDSLHPHPPFKPGAGSSPLPQGRGDQKVQEKTKISVKTPKRSSSKFAKPVEGKIISSYGPKAGGQHNDGINIQAPKGAPVRAAENGVVVYAGNELKGSGNLVLVRHDGRWMTAYAHMDRLLISRGTVVKRGQSIGTVGSTGSVDSPQLHFEVRRGTEAINPVKYLE